jgi:hypothetical protein
MLEVEGVFDFFGKKELFKTKGGIKRKQLIPKLLTKAKTSPQNDPKGNIRTKVSLI